MKSIKKIYVTEPDEIKLASVSGLLRKYGYGLVSGNTDFSKNIPQSFETILIRTYTNVGEDILFSFPELKNIIRVGVGIDNIDVNLCKKRNINIYNSAGANSNAVAEYVVAMSLLALRKLNFSTREDLRHWNRNKFMSNELPNKIVGLVGFGNVAKLVYAKLSALGCSKFYVYDPYVNLDKSAYKNVILVKSLDKLFKKSDVVSLHVPLNKSTFHLINKNNLPYFKKDSVLINSSRGAIVSEMDIIKVLKKENLLYIADVFENEPHVNKKLLSLKNFVGTPHIASMTKEANGEMVRRAIKNFIQNKPLRLTN